MRKRAYRLSLPRWAILPRESWYGEMGAAGLHVRRAGPVLTRFERAAPAPVRYRFELGAGEGGALAPGQQAFYAECGWELVMRDGPLSLFCAPAGADVPELHTDPASQAAVLKALRPSILRSVLGEALWAALLLAQLTYLGNYSLRLLRAEGAGVILAALAACTLFRVGWGLYGLAALLKNRRRLASGRLLEHDAHWRGTALARRISCGVLAAVYAVCLGVGGAELARHETAPLPADGGELPLVMLAQLEEEGYRRADEAAPFRREAMNRLQSGWSPAAPLRYESRECGFTGAGENDAVYLDQRYYRLADAQGAKAFGVDVLEKAWLEPAASYETLWESGDTLALRYAEDDVSFHMTCLLLVDGPHVLFVHYWGGQADSAAVTAAAAAQLAAFGGARGR